MIELPDNLKIKDRFKRPVTDFNNEDKLYRGFNHYSLDQENNKIRIETIRFPDFSCNWSKFSTPQDVRYRKNSDINDGCYSFTVKTARYKGYANPVHDPIKEDIYENYAHVEVRELYEGEDFNSEPPKQRPKRRKSLRHEYRQNMLNNLTIEFNIKKDNAPVNENNDMLSENFIF